MGHLLFAPIMWAVDGFFTDLAQPGEIETANELKRRIDEAARYVPLEQLALSPQCGFSSTVLGNNITVEAEIAKLALVVRVAGEVWG